MDIEILSDASSDEAEVEHTANAITETMETPPPTLTIGTVLQELPKLKSGKTASLLFSERPFMEKLKFLLSFLVFIGVEFEFFSLPVIEFFIDICLILSL